MDVLPLIDRVTQHVLHDERFTANLIALAIAQGVILVVWLGVRRLLTGGLGQIACATGYPWLDTAAKFAVRQIQLVAGWLCCTAFLATIIVGAGYHLAGGHIQNDLLTCYERLTLDQLLAIGTRLGLLFAILLAARVLVGTARRSRPYLEQRVGRSLGKHARQKELLPQWFSLLERYAAAVVLLTAVWAAGHVVEVSTVTDPSATFLFRMISILVVSRLLTLAFRALSAPMADLGDKHLSRTVFTHYWERMTRLIPLAERCFEAAVYVATASLCVHELGLVPAQTGEAGWGQACVQCIGIFFGTRVLIELSQVLLNELFGMYSESPISGQKGQTLVPLLHSVTQYALYLGSGVMMLQVIGLKPWPILAGAGIVGLAVGLGAQSLVTDVVSGLFILFETQYLVGDFVQIGDARGIVEALAVRHTQIRDEQGRLHIIPNGQIKSVVNFSKGFVNAVVDIKVPAGTDLDALFKAMTDAGRTLRQSRKEILADTVIQGLVELSLAEMTVRAVTRVRPGTHVQMEAEYRRVLKLALDRNPVAERSLRVA